MSAALLCSTLLAYLLGSLPAGVLYSRRRGRDIRGRDLPGGSGSWRQYGPAVGIGVALLDALRGTLAVALALWINAGSWNAAADAWAAALATFAVVMGHCYPVFFGLRGGGGIATLIGALALAAPEALVGASLAAAVTMPIYKLGLQRWVGLNVVPVAALVAAPVAVYLARQYGGLPAALLGSAAMAVRAAHLLWLMRTGRGAGQRSAAIQEDNNA